jgi:hypothetical protein
LVVIGQKRLFANRRNDTELVYTLYNHQMSSFSWRFGG